MSVKIMDINDLSDSREVMAKKVPPATTVFICFVAMMLIAAFIWAYFGKIDTYVIAAGEIRSAETPSTITLRNGGKIANIIIADGAFVHEGDTIIELDRDYYEKQQSLLDEQIAKKESDIANYQQLIKSIQNDDNMFHESRDPVFYYQYENYRLELEAANKKIASTNDQVSATSKGYELAIDYVADNLKSVQVLYKEYQALYAAVESGGTYTGANQTVTSVYNSYKSSLDKARISYSAYEEAYMQLLREYELSGTGSTPSESENETMPDPNDMFPEKTANGTANNESTDTDESKTAAAGAPGNFDTGGASQTTSLSSVTAEQVRQAKYSMDTAQADMAAIKMSALEQITATLDKLNEQASAYQSNISEYRAKDGALLYDDSREISRQQIKNGYYIDISNSIVSLRQELKTLESQKLDVEETSANLSISAARSGILLYSQNCAIGDVVSGGSTIASIIPESGGYEIELYIPDGKISEVHVGQEIEYTFEAVSVTDFGKAQGKITDISADSFTNQTDGGKYYKATATIDNTVLTGDNGETRVLKIGMLTKAHAKTGTQSILSWLLDKLNLHIS